MGRFVRWLRHGDYSPTGECFDCGITTRAAIERFERTDQPISGNWDPMSAGNGCLMRLSPVAIWHHDDEVKAGEAARRQSATTHGAAECLEASDFFARLLVRAMSGIPKQALLEPVTWPGGGKVGEVSIGGWRSKVRSQIKASGYVIDSLEASLWAIGNAENFEDALVAAVNLGEDSDTVGAITGQLAGAIWGYSTIPVRWREPIAWRERLEKAALALLQDRRL
jgi:ADP-ribosyl-[dinitrogen reductase] hydrolase